MTNADIADVLEEIADVLEIKGENTFKVRSYRRAAETIAHCPFAVEAHPDSDELRALPGIGEGLAGKIVEIAQTGTCAYREGILEGFPRGLLDVLKVPGVGPKKAAAFHGQLGVTDLVSLEAAALAGRLAALPKMGEKSQQKVLDGIALLKKVAGRLLLSEAAEVAEGLIACLPAGCRAIAAGSLRRGKETVGDIDVLAVPCDSEGQGPMEAFLAMPSVESVMRQGDTRSSVLLTSGVQADLRVVPEESFGAALQYFTGSQQHNIRIRELAQTMGLRVNEYGVFDAEGRALAGRTEEDVYAALGLAWIPPELREDQGELDCAAAGAIPRLVELSDIRGDLQMHSTHSDGAHTMREMALAARALGWEYIAITDHSKSLAIANGLDEGRLLGQVEEIEALNEELEGITVLSGCEVEILSDGRLDIADEVLARLDVVLACVHSGLGGSPEAMTERMMRAARHRHVDIIGHPTGRVIGQREASGVDLERLVRTCVEHGKALEVNAGPSRLDLCDVHVRQALEMGARLCISTDAHRAENLAWMRFGVQTARRGWAERRHIVNTLPLAELRQWLGGNRACE